VPDNNNSSIDGNNIRERLASLDSDFNTNQGFGFQGIMAAQEEKERQLNATAKAEVVEQETAPAKDPMEWIAPLNTSIQTIRGEVQQGIGALANEINQLKQSRQTDEFAPAYDVPPEVLPVVQRYENEISNLKKTTGELAVRQEWQRAQNALREARSKYKDFNYTDDELNQVWTGHVRNNPNVAASTNWDSYFKTQYEARVNPRLAEENTKLKADLERLKSGRNSVQDLYAVPRSNRQGPTVTAKNSDDSDFNEELYQRARSKIQKGKFMGFNRALMDEQRKLAMAV